MADLDTFVVVWLVTWLLHSTLLYGGAALVDRLRLLRAPAAREHLWRAAMIGALLTATAQSAGLVERVPLGQLFAAPATPAPAAADPTLSVSLTLAPSPELAVVSSTPAAPAAPPAPADRPWLDRLRASLAASWADALLLLWSVGAGLALLRLLALGWLARRELADRAPAQGALAAEFAWLCAALHVRRPALCVAPALAGPVSLPNGEIAVPPWALASLDARQRQALLAHELAHQVRRDPQWMTFALGLQALLWLQPLHALARRRLAALAELQADAWAARAVNDPRALAECLAECAERLTGRATDRRVALFGAAMNHDSLLVERVDRLLEGLAMRAQTTSWTVRGGVLAALIAAAFTFPGCDINSIHMTDSGSSTTISISDDGDASVKVWRPDYALHMESDGATTFTADESDIATLSPNCSFTLEETLDGVERAYTVKADSSGTLTRRLTRNDVDVSLDEAGRQWLAEALPRMFRESGYDAEARVARLLASGGPGRVLEEVELARAAHAKAAYLGELLGTAQLDAEQTALALAAAAKIDSAYELHSALSRALATQSIDAPRFALLLRTAAHIDSDYELAELLAEAAPLLPDDADARAAWVAAAEEIDSDFELGRAIEAGFRRSEADAAFSADLIALAARRMDSDFELRTTLELVAPRAAAPAIAAAYLEAAGKIESDFERASALTVLLGAAPLDDARLATALDVTAGISSSYEKCEVLKALAGSVVKHEVLSRRYRDVASTLSSFERGEALTALDEAGRN